MPHTSANSLDQHVPQFDSVHLWIVTMVGTETAGAATARAKLFIVCCFMSRFSTVRSFPPTADLG